MFPAILVRDAICTFLPFPPPSPSLCFSFVTVFLLFLLFLLFLAFHRRRRRRRRRQRRQRRRRRRRRSIVLTYFCCKGCARFTEGDIPMDNMEEEAERRRNSQGPWRALILLGHGPSSLFSVVRWYPLRYLASSPSISSCSTLSFLGTSLLLTFSSRSVRRFAFFFSIAALFPALRFLLFGLLLGLGRPTFPRGLLSPSSSLSSLLHSFFCHPLSSTLFLWISFCPPVSSILLFSRSFYSIPLYPMLADRPLLFFYPSQALIERQESSPGFETLRSNVGDAFLEAIRSSRCKSKDSIGWFILGSWNCLRFTAGTSWFARYRGSRVRRLAWRWAKSIARETRVAITAAKSPVAITAGKRTLLLLLLRSSYSGHELTLFCSLVFAHTNVGCAAFPFHFLRGMLGPVAHTCKSICLPIFDDVWTLCFFSFF